jgi:hypothetical protein
MINWCTAAKKFFAEELLKELEAFSGRDVIWRTGKELTMFFSMTS